MTEAAPNQCFHCGEPLPPGKPIYAKLSQPMPVCCEGCRAVAELIAGVGLQDYYRFRCAAGNKPEGDVDAWSAFAQADIAAQYLRDEPHAQQSVSLLIDGLRCAACNWLIERRLRSLPGVVAAQLNPASGRARVVWQSGACDLSSVLRAVAELGYRPQPIGIEAGADTLQQAVQVERRTALKRLGVAGLGMMQVMMYVLPLYVRQQTGMDDAVAHFLQYISLLITTPVLLYAGWPFLNGALRSLRQRTISMDVPVALALVLAYGASVVNVWRGAGEVYFDSVTMFIFLLTLGRYIEMVVRHRNSSITDALARIQPRLAHRKLTDGDGWQDVPVQRVQLGDELLVRVGEAVPTDGVVLQGVSTLDESLLTGESLPVVRAPGAAVLAGAINVEAPLRIRVTAIGAATVLSSIVRLLEQAQTDKPKLAQMTERIARHFLQAMLWFTVIVGVVWWRLDPDRAFDAVLAVLVVTCPCALSLATPVVIAAAVSALARRGLLITRADAIERLAQVDQMLFDKTGTLTCGQIELQRIVTLGELNASQCHAIAAALEQAADHPLAHAIREGVYSKLAAEQISVVPGAGVQGVIAGRRYRIGTPVYVAQLRGATANESGSIVLGDEQAELAHFVLSDVVRADAGAAIAQLHALGVRTALISGDAEAAVATLAKNCGIDAYRARQTPADKVRSLQSYDEQAVVAMVGDGINDAPVLAAAAVSIAMGGGTALAQASADAVLMNNSLLTLPQALVLARRAQRILRQNLVWAAAYNLLAIPLAATGLITPWLAAAGMSVSSVLVVLNAARLLRVTGDSEFTRDGAARIGRWTTVPQLG